MKRLICWLLGHATVQVQGGARCWRCNQFWLCPGAEMMELRPLPRRSGKTIQFYNYNPCPTAWVKPIEGLSATYCPNFGCSKPYPHEHVIEGPAQGEK